MKSKHEITNDIFVTGSAGIYWFYLNTDCNSGCQIVEIVIDPAAVEGTEGLSNEDFWDHLCNHCNTFLHDCTDYSSDRYEEWARAYNTWIYSPHFEGTTPETRKSIYNYFETLRRAERECKSWGI